MWHTACPACLLSLLEKPLILRLVVSKRETPTKFNMDNRYAKKNIIKSLSRDKIQSLKCIYPWFTPFQTVDHHGFNHQTVQRMKLAPNGTPGPVDATTFWFGAHQNCCCCCWWAGGDLFLLLLLLPVWLLALLMLVLILFPRYNKTIEGYGWFFIR